MRGFQRSITHSFAVIAILVMAVALSAGYFTFYLDAKKSGKFSKNETINSFEDCAKHYPVMELYPEQCNTPDGKHFTRELSKEESKNLPTPNSSVSSDLEWKVYVNPKYKFLVEYPASWSLLEPAGEFDDVYIIPSEYVVTVSGSDSFTPDSPLLGIRIKPEAPFSESPQGNKSESGIPFITDWKTVKAGSLSGVYYVTHQCAPQCLTLVDFPYKSGDGTISVFISSVAKDKGYAQLFDRMYKSFKYF